MNSTCYHAAVPFIYHTLALEISTKDGLDRVVTELIDQPLRKNYLTHARRLNVEGKMICSGARVTEQRPEELPLERRPHDSDDRPHISLNVSDLEPDYEKFLSCEEEDDGPTEVSRSWEPLASLIARLEHLAELNYACVNQFPPCLLKALHQHHPACRLNLHTFRFRSLRKSETDPYEIELISSPCLHSVTVRHFCHYDSNGDPDYNQDAVLWAVTIAPNLKHVKLQCCRFPPSPEGNMPVPIRKQPRQPWQGFIPPVDTYRIGRLISLSLQGMVITEQSLEQWSRHTDLSRLQALALGRFRGAENYDESRNNGSIQVLGEASSNLGGL